MNSESVDRSKSLLNTLTYAGLILLLSTASIASAQITIDRAILEFSQQNPVQNVIVTNTGEHDVYIQTLLHEVINPHEKAPRRVPILDPRSAPMLVSPQQALIPAGQRKRVRIIMREPAVDKDKVYRLTVKPYVGKVTFNKGKSSQKSSGIKVSVGFNLLLIARPEQRNVDVQVRRTTESIFFTNHGNTNVLLSKLTQCTELKEDCVQLTPDRLYAGESRQYELPLKGTPQAFPVEVVQVAGNTSRRDFY